MLNNKIANTLLCTLVLLATTMFVWTVNYITTATSTTQVQTVISAFNA